MHGIDHFSDETTDPEVGKYSGLLMRWIKYGR